ncbi:MAG: hypothetical protein ACHQWH_03735 [Nitrososphaerales archaeon]
MAEDLAMNSDVSPAFATLQEYCMLWMEIYAGYQGMVSDAEAAEAASIEAFNCLHN